ncbi:MAG: hypothetical protein HY314_05220 [Acidobacteria bacterium]|nr:hypothetical protein [Acidobacteriota bacterium]
MNYSIGTIRNPQSAIRNWQGLSSDVRIIAELLVEGYKPLDIAVLLQIPVSAVRARLRRLRRFQRLGNEVALLDQYEASLTKLHRMHVIRVQETH